jgi:hypothetical protein
MRLAAITRFVSDHAPTILTSLSAAGLAASVGLAIRASFKAADLVWVAREESSLHGRDHDRMDDIRAAWKPFVPVVGTTLMTAAFIIASHRVNSGRAAALVATAAFSERAFSEYQEKVVERLGERKEKTLREDLAQDQVNRRPVPEGIVTANSGGILCHEAFTGRYFWSDIEALRKAQNDINYQLLHENYASLSDFYNFLGVPCTSYSSEVGWSSDMQMELTYTSILSDDNRPCLSIDYTIKPVRKYDKAW